MRPQPLSVMPDCPRIDGYKQINEPPKAIGDLLSSFTQFRRRAINLAAQDRSVVAISLARLFLRRQLAH